MKRWKDPFPPTPQGFHDRVEQTLRGLEDNNMKRIRYKKLAIAAVAALIAILAATAAAVVSGNSRFKQVLTDSGADEIAELVQEVHMTGDGNEAAWDFAFSVDEIIWEDADLYLTYSLSVPNDGERYMVALFNPTLNGEPMLYKAKGWTESSFFDTNQVALLLGGQAPAQCSELLTFAVNPRLRERRDNALRFRAVLLRPGFDFTPVGKWGDGLGFSPADSVILTWGDSDAPDFWSDSDAPDFLNQFSAAEQDVLRRIKDAAGDNGELTLNELVSTGYVEILTEREVSMRLDASRLTQAVYNDVAEHSFEVNGCRVEIEGFHMTHLGIDVDLRAIAPSGLTEEEGMALTYGVVSPGEDDDGQAVWSFLRPDGSRLSAIEQGTSSSAGYQPLPDGTATYAFYVEMDGAIPLDGIDAIVMVPVRYGDWDENGEQSSEVLMDYAIELRPVYSDAVARAEANATPQPTLTPEEEEAFAHAFVEADSEEGRQVKRDVVAEWQPGDPTVTVYCTKSGTYYHVFPECSGMRNAWPRDIGDAVKAGKRPCPVCVGGLDGAEESASILW